MELLVRLADLDLNGEGAEIVSSLACAASRGNLRVNGRLLRREWTSAAANRPDWIGMTPLHWAANGNQFMALKMLLQRGDVDVNARERRGASALAQAAGAGLAWVVTTLVWYGRADVNASDNEGFTPLMRAASGNHIEAMKVLLECEKVDVHARSVRGETALAVAAWSGRVDAVALLLGHGDVDINARDNGGRTVLALAIGGLSAVNEAGYYATEKLLREHGAIK